MRGKTALALIFGMAGLGAIGIALAVHFGGSPLSIISNLPEFSLVDAQDRPFTLKEMKGTAAVVDFFFTRCQGPCPTMALEMGKLQQQFAADPRLRYISISVDPTNDTTAVLRDYASSVGAMPERWLFLTGDPDSITTLSEKGFMLPAST